MKSNEIYFFILWKKGESPGKYVDDFPVILLFQKFIHIYVFPAPVFHVSRRHSAVFSICILTVIHRQTADMEIPADSLFTEFSGILSVKSEDAV